MKNLFKICIVVFCIQIIFCVNKASAQLTPEKLGWEMGVQTYSLRNGSFFEAVDKIKSIGLKYVEAYPGQKVGGDIAGNMDYKMNATDRKKILDYLHQRGMKLISYGVVVPENDADWRKLFVFAKEMGLVNIVSEPHPDQMDIVSKLCDEYKINVAIHDHPKPSHYWTPDSLLVVLKGRSHRIGACADIGHWAFSGLNVMDCLKKLDGRIIELHFKDVSNMEPEPNEKTEVLGKGIIDIKAVIKELYRQHFKGLVAMEYEDNPENNLPQIKESVDYIKEVVTKLK